MTRAAHKRRRQGVAVHVRIVAQDRHSNGRVFIGAGGVVGRNRWVVDRRDGQSNRGNVAVELAVVGLVGEAVGAVVIGGGRVDERAIGVESQAPVRWPGDLDRR